ncbi:hypothetical protein CFAM422_001214 [Trichoderma lentiforme]|uniref:Uncharacterized protein n=1 Tax=Trichoderma lentiforme TaxID=1567552 RepID=A0A9P4XN17_9HYPO|nr:hypothetical protein CFAM422_001214 [Trichoderma lentiforme]
MTQILVLSTRYPRSWGDIQATGPASSWNAADQRASVLGWAGLLLPRSGNLDGPECAPSAKVPSKYSLPGNTQPTDWPALVCQRNIESQEERRNLLGLRPARRGQRFCGRNYGDVGDGAAVKAEKF